MRFSEVAARFNGFSTPIFGVSWEPPRSDVAAAREMVTFLEDRRVLYSANEVEVPEHVTSSILEIRRRMTTILEPGGLAKNLEESLRTIRAACRKFLDRYGSREAPSGKLYLPATDFGTAHRMDPAFNQALGELRGVVGVVVAKVAAAYGLDVEDGLAQILPAEDTN